MSLQPVFIFSKLIGRIASVAMIATVATLFCGQTASASAAVISVTAPTTASATVAPSATVALTGASISDSNGSGDHLLITVSAGSGDVTFTETSGLTLATGYSSFTNVPTVAFQGAVSDINAALASLEYTAPAQTTSDSVSITATSLADAGGNTIAYLPSTGHFYEYVADPQVSWYTAQADANSMSFDGAEGYLATIPSATVSNFIEQHLAAHDVWAGGESFDYPSGYGGDSSIQRVWIWADDANQFPSDNSFTPDSSYYGGPLAGEIFTECQNVASSCTFTNQSAWAGAGDDAASWIESTWNNGEPNNSDSYGWTANNLALGPLNGEHYLELNTSGGQYWNDLSPYQSTNGANIQGYVVEFGNAWGSPSTFSDGQGTGSTSVTVADVPSAATGVAVDAVSPAGGQARVSWSASSSDGGSAITGYRVTAMPGGETCSTAGTSCTVSGLVDGTTYTFAVTAVNAAGDSAPDTSAPATVLGAPLAPTGLSAVGVSSDGGQVTLSWTAPLDGGSPITGYTATASPGGGSCTTVATTCTISGLTDGDLYSFVVTAANAIGTSAPSAALTLTPSTPPTATPSTAQSAPALADDRLAVDSEGSVTLSLSCSGGTAMCDESGTVGIPAVALGARGHGMVSVALIKGVDIAAGSTVTTEIKLPPTVLRELQARGIHRVKLTVSLKSGSSTTVETVTTLVPTGLAVCPAAGGSITGTTLGLVHLGESIRSIEDRYLDHVAQGFGFERFCLSTRGAFRVETPAKGFLAAIEDGMQGKVILALTANRHYTLDGLYAGERLGEADRIHSLGVGIASGLNTWYVIPGAKTNGVLKVHDGTIAEVGIASRQLTSTEPERLALFRQAELPGH